MYPGSIISFPITELHKLRFTFHMTGIQFVLDSHQKRVVHSRLGGDGQINIGWTSCLRHSRGLYSVKKTKNLQNHQKKKNLCSLQKQKFLEKYNHRKPITIRSLCV